MPDEALQTYDLEKRSQSFRCLFCKWKFRCPVEQIGRIICRSCESIRDAETAAQAR